MSIIGAEAPPRAEGGGRVVRRRTLRVWLWVLLSCALLGASGLVRAWQDRRLDEIAVASEPAPFPLKDLPRELPGWRYVEGGDQRLDPQVARISGSSDHLIRTYVNEVTGVTVTALIIYGHGQILSQHVPEACYPTAGFTQAEEPVDRDLPTGQGPAAFRSVVFSRTGGPVEDREEVYYSFRHEGRWYPDAAGDWKRFRHNPSMFKVQVQRRLAPRERRHVANPTEQFLAAFVPVLERRAARGTPPADAKGQAPAGAAKQP